MKTKFISYLGVDNAYAGVAPIEVNGLEPKYHKYYQVRIESKMFKQRRQQIIVFTLSVGGPAAHSAGLPVLCAPVAVEVCRGEENVYARRGNIFFTCGSKYYN